MNGVVRTYQNIVRELCEQGYDVKIISPKDFKTFPMPFYPEIRLALFPYRTMARMIEEFAPDAICIPVEGPLGWAARRYCLKHDKPFTSSFHTHFPDYVAKRVPSFLRGTVRGYVIRLVRKFHAPAQAVFVATPSLEDQLRHWGFQNTFIRLTRGVDVSIFHPLARENEKNKDKPTLLYVGRVAVEKNIEDFLNLPIASHKIVVGKGPDLEKLRHAYPDVHFAGLQQGKALGDYYRKADCFVFPSKTETFGIVLIEAMACGLPVAGYDVTGPKDLIAQDFLGAYDADLKIAVERALATPGTARQRHDYVRAHYSWGNVAQIFKVGFTDNASDRHARAYHADRSKNG